MAPTRNTVDRLDKASSYTSNKVLTLDVDENVVETRALTTLTPCQSRKRKRHGRDEDDDMDGGRQKSPDPLDKLANATTLYVGNL